METKKHSNEYILKFTKILVFLLIHVKKFILSINGNYSLKPKWEIDSTQAESNVLYSTVYYLVLILLVIIHSRK